MTLRTRKTVRSTFVVAGLPKTLGDAGRLYRRSASYPRYQFRSNQADGVSEAAQSIPAVHAALEGRYRIACSRIKRRTSFSWMR